MSRRTRTESTWSVRLIDPTSNDLYNGFVAAYRAAGVANPTSPAAQTAKTAGLLGHFGSGGDNFVSYVFARDEDGRTLFRIFPRPRRDVLAPVLLALIRSA